jgi:hypothetical protein
LGFFVWSSNGYGKLRNCINNGNIILDVNNQTVVEIFVFSEYMTELSNCINNGDIIMNGIPAYSAITCFVDIGTKVYNCINTGNIYAKKTDVIGVFANKNGGSILNCVNTGNLTGEVKAGGIVGQSYFYNDIDIPNKIENCLNAGEIFGNESVGGIIAEFDNYVPFHNGMIIRNNIDLSKTSKYALFGQDINEYPDGLIVENNFYDKQIVTVPAMPGGDIAGKAEGKLTSELTGFALQNILGNGWSYAEGRYPIPLGFENHPAALLAATPVYLHADDAENFNTVDSVTENFTVGLENSAEWQTTTNKVFLDGENGILQSTGYEMLMCSLGNYSKNINLIIKSIPSEVPIIKSGEFSVFPNPAKDELKIENGELKINNIQITDLTGKIVLNPILIENSIDVSGLNAGIYLVKIYTDKGVAVQKIIKK